jgi:glutamate racemase
MPDADHNAPLGVFDSGVGGLTVVRALMDVLPGESIVYLGDTARVPYGSKSPDTIRKFAIEDTQFLLSKHVKAVVVACNTATAHAMSVLQSMFRLPVIGVLEPGVEATLADANCQRVGVIGTAGTIRSCAYQHALSMRRPDLQIEARATPLLVPLIEEGWIGHPATKMIVREYLKPLLERGMDTLVLGCTHYPLLKPLLSKMLRNRVRLVDSALVCAEHVKRLLTDRGLLRTAKGKPRLELFLTDLSEHFDALARRFLRADFGKVQRVSL